MKYEKPVHKRDARLADAFHKAIYATNSPTGRFCDSKGYEMLKKAAYEAQRDFSHELIARDNEENFDLLYQQGENADGNV